MALVLAAAGAARVGPPVLVTGWARVASLAAPFQGSGATRLAIWRDTVRLVAARALVGWGPDTFGLVYPAFRTVPGVLVDKAHSDLLQVAATQGLVGVAALVLALAALALAFWRGRRAACAAALLGALVAYEVSVQVAFGWVPVTAPFWILAAAATSAWAAADAADARVVVIPLTQMARTSLAAAGILLPLGIAVLLAGMPFLADTFSLQGTAAQTRGDNAAARIWLAEARRLAPQESTYAAEDGDCAMDMGPDGRPGPDADWAAARRAYLDAANLGTDQPLVYYRLAMADHALGRTAEADAATQQAKRLAGQAGLSQEPGLI